MTLRRRMTLARHFCGLLYDPATGKFLATNEEKDDLLAEKHRLLAETAGLIAEERRARQTARATESLPG